MEDAAEIVAFARDVALLLLFLVLAVVMLALYAKVSSLLSSARRTVRDAERIASTLNDRFAKPLAGASATAFTAGKAAAFVAGFRGRRQRDERRRLKQG